MAYVLGYFAADGSMVQNNRGAHFIEFTTTDKGFLNVLQKRFNSNHKITKRLVKNSAWKQSYRLQIGSKEWFSDLQKLGFTQNKSNTLRFPRVPSEYLTDFVRGYFDGDGCVYFKKHFAKDRGKERWVFTTRFTSGSQKFLKKLLIVLRTSGLHGGFIVGKHTQSGCDLVFSHKDSLALYHFLYKNTKVTELFLPRKYKLFTKAIETLYPEMRP